MRWLLHRFMVHTLRAHPRISRTGARGAELWWTPGQTLIFFSFHMVSPYMFYWYFFFHLSPAIPPCAFSVQITVPTNQKPLVCAWHGSSLNSAVQLYVSTCYTLAISVAIAVSPHSQNAPRCLAPAKNGHLCQRWRPYLATLNSGEIPTKRGWRTKPLMTAIKVWTGLDASGHQTENNGRFD